MSRFVVKAALAAVMLNASMAPVFAQTVSMTPQLKELAAAANKEGELLVTWSSGTMGGPQGAKAFEDGINKAYGTKIKVKWAPGPSMPNVGNQIAMRFGSGLSSPTDVYLGFSRNMAQLLKYDMFLSAPWGDYLPGRLTDRIVERNTYIKIVSATLGWTYNAKLAPSKPEHLEDFLKPEWKGKVATTAFGGGFDQIGAKDAWGQDRAIEFAKKFSQQVGGFMRCNEMDRLSTGEFLALVTDCSGDSARDAMKAGAPLGRVLAPDIPIISYFYFAVPKNAEHPNLGKLFSVFASSVEGQQVIFDQTSGNLHLYPESPEAKEVKDVEDKYNFKFKDADIEWQTTNDEGNGAQQQVEKILQRDAK
jgi:ABC-type Fe3+ transport system substrate-binding protein